MFNFLFVGTKHNHDHDDNMEMKSKMGLTHITTITTVMAAALSCVAEVHGQILTVNLQSDESYAWNPSTLSCSYTVFDARYNFWNLQWYKGITISDHLAISIADFFGGISSPRLFNGYDDNSKYTVSRDSTSSISTLHILSVNFTKDSGRYWCRVTVVDPGVSQIQDSDSTEVVVFFLPTSITLSDSNGFFPPTGGKSYLVEGVEHEYTCQVPDINPGASFAWSVGGGGITLGTTNNTTGSDGLITSTGTAILSPTWNNHGQVLQCQASNKNGHAGVSVQVVLDVKVPPKVSRMSLHNSTGSRLNVSVDIDEGKQETFTCKAQSRPAAKMEWFLDDASQSVIDAPIGGGDGLINTTSSWSLTAVRGNHGQRVKCEASTAESDINALPSVTVTINVNGPPDNVDISGSTLMTEDVASTLTCTAANAYPEHWSLVWSNVSSNGDIDIPGATLDPPSSTNGRYTFTSRLDLTLSRHDNGNSIRCAARWNTWTPEPQDTFGPLNVQFCTKSVSLMQTTAVAGRTASLTCTSETSNPATNLTWSMEGVELTMPTDQPNTPGDYGGKVTRVTYTTGVLNRTSNGDVYKCCATKGAIPSCVTPLCEMHTLNVLYAPDFQQLILVPDTPIIEGSNVSLTCTVDANPAGAVITWENQGDTLSSVSNGATNTLSLRDVRRQQAGHYTCRANNGVPADNPMDVVSDPVTVIVHYEVNITNKGMIEQNGNDGGSASLTCIAKGNPRPTMQWYGLNNKMITNETDTAKFMVANVITGGDGVYGFQVISALTINDIDSDMDFGTYTCISTNGIGEEDMLEVNLTGTRSPDKPIRVMITGQTAESLTVTWTAGYNGGEEQSFRVSYLKTLDSTKTSTGDNVTGGNTTYLVTGLEVYTEYEIRVYARNDIGENTDYAKVVGHTLPRSPSSDLGINVEYNTDAGTVRVTGLKAENSCIQLEVKYEGSDTWQECGKCIAYDQTVALSEWCTASQKRRRRAVGDIEDIRAKLCIDGLCSEAAPAKQAESTIPVPTKPASNTGMIVGVIVAVVVLLLVIVLGVYVKRNFKLRSNSEEDNETQCTAKNLCLESTISQVPRYTDTDAQSPYQEITELGAIGQQANQDQGAATYSNVNMVKRGFPRNQLKIVKELGHGAFGLVLLAEARGITEMSKVTLVAVKTLKDGASNTDRDGIMKELDLMRKLPDHCNVVRLLGFCIDEDAPYIIVEYLSRGNLKDLLQDSRSKGGRVYGNLHGISKSLTSKDLMKFAKDVADGMAFISSQKCIHRDLAARNVLVAEDMLCKVSDFGLARDVMNIRVYERGSEGALPMRWMALESLLDDVYTTESDVWSFGVLLWEIVTLGSRPYPAMTAKVMVAELESGYRMPKPKHCQHELYEMMLRCWDEDPENRHTFKVISEQLEGLINKGKEYISVKNFQESFYEVVQPEDKGEKV